MATPFNYNLALTGDCLNTSSGVISLELYGGVPPYTVDWVDPVFPPDVITTEPAIQTGLSSGVYSVRVNDSMVPTNSSFYINIPVSSGVCCSIVAVQNTTCNLFNGSVTGTSTSLYSSTNFYVYQSDNTFVQSGTTNLSTITFGGLSAGTYYLIAQDLGGCSGQSQTFIIENSSEFNFGLYTVPNSSCGGTPIGKIFVTGQTGVPPYTYVWSNAFTTSSITGLTKGDYSVTVTDAKGCSQTQSTTVVDVDQIGLGIFTVTQPSCFASDGVINLTITGGTAPYYYSASTGDVLISYSQTYSLSGLSSGNYNFLVTDSGLCQLLTNVTLLTPLGMASVTVNGQNSTCNATNGQISISVVGGTTPYQYTLIYPDYSQDNVSSSQTTQIFSNLDTGVYGVIVQDSSSCYYTTEVILINENSFTIGTSVTGTTCNQNNGLVTVTKSVGGTAPYDYILDNSTSVIDTNLSAVTFTNLSAGQHTISVVDAIGCTQTTQFYITSSENLNYTLYSTSCGNGSDGSITTIITSGKPPFTFNWSNNVPNNPQEIIATGLTAGTYSIIIVDNNGCSLSRTTSIDCATSYVSYQTYVMGSEVFNVQSPSKLGLLQMLNEGFVDLTSGNTSCDLVSAIFTAKVSVKPLGTVVTQTFFTATTLVNAPSDNLWYDTLKSLLLSISGVGNVTIDAINNQITIETSKTNNSLSGQEIIVELVIVYDIMCLT